MENIGAEFGNIIAQRLEALGKKPFAVETEKDLPPDSIRNVMRAKNPSGPTLSKVQQICEALGLELYIGPPRETGPVNAVTIGEDEFAQIAVHEATLAAGCGASNAEEEVIGHLAFRRSWLMRIGTAASNASLVRAQGNSMSPTIQDGDMLLVDRARVEIPITRTNAKISKKPRIYAFTHEGLARVKRIERPEEGVMILISDNPDHAPEILIGSRISSINIIGRVMWWGHTEGA